VNSLAPLITFRRVGKVGTEPARKLHNSKLLRFCFCKLASRGGASVRRLDLQRVSCPRGDASEDASRRRSISAALAAHRLLQFQANSLALDRPSASISQPDHRSSRSPHKREMPGYARSSCSAFFSACSALQSEHVRQRVPQLQSAVSRASCSSIARFTTRPLCETVAIGAEIRPIRRGAIATLRPNTHSSNSS